MIELDLLAAGSRSLADTLAEVAASAARVIASADGVAVALLVPDASVVDAATDRAASDRLTASVDSVQYDAAREGPSLAALTQREAVISADLGADSRWTRFGPRAARLGVLSAMSLPMILPDGTAVGALTAYARERAAFDENDARLAGPLAAPAAVAVHNAHVLRAVRTTADQLQAALVSRAVIDQAIGIIRSRSGLTTAEAFSRLRTVSQNKNIKVSVVAQQMVDDAVRRARARRATD